MIAVAAPVVLAFILAVIGGLIAVIELARGHLQPFLAWAVLAVAVAIIFLTIKVVG